MADSVNQVQMTAQRGGRLHFFRFLGPAILVSVGYMDPGNWATDLEAGVRFGYQLLWVLVLSNVLALLLQNQCARLGVVTGRDLAQACRENYQRPVVLCLWLLCEVAIIACDLAEVIGSAVALNLLFGIPLSVAALVTAINVFFVLLLQRYGITKLEALVGVMVVTIGCCLFAQVVMVHPDWPLVMAGFTPRLSEPSLYVAIGILGATVMPHNLYLQSAMVKTRVVGPGLQARRAALRNSFFNTLIALNAAFLINAAILIVASATFHRFGIPVEDLRQAHDLLAPVLGVALAPTLFAIALLCAGQSSTVTGTMAGQIVMEGFLRIRWSPFARSLLTRGLAMVPAVLVLNLAGEESMLMLLVATQVVLSLQLPFAIVPLLRFTDDARLMGAFRTRTPLRIAGWASAALIIAANCWLVYTLTLRLNGVALVIAVLAEALGIFLLAYIAFVPLSGKTADKAVMGVEILT